MQCLGEKLCGVDMPAPARTQTPIYIYIYIYILAPGVEQSWDAFGWLQGLRSSSCWKYCQLYGILRASKSRGKIKNDKPVNGKIPIRQNPDFRPIFPTWRRFHVIKDIAFLKPVNRAELLTDWSHWGRVSGTVAFVAIRWVEPNFQTTLVVFVR